jgi:hypothetical protein
MPSDEEIITVAMSRMMVGFSLLALSSALIAFSLL